jgi:predicted nucleic acid-binding protein
MQIIDSNIIIYSANPEYSFLRKYFTSDEYFVASISVIEVLGYHKLVAADKKYFDAVFKIIPIIPLTEDIINEAVAIRQTYNISVADSIIAATTITTHAELVTRNTEDFKNIKKLKPFNPFER